MKNFKVFTLIIMMVTLALGGTANGGALLPDVRRGWYHR